MAWKVFDNNGAILVNLDTSNASGPIAFLVINGIVAEPGGGQANATQLTAVYNFVDVVASNEDSVKLLPAKKNTIMVVTNRGVGDLNVFPYFGDSFYGQSANLPYAYPIVNGSAISVISDVNGTWSLIP